METPTITYCETNLDAFIKQAPSTYTNLAFLLVVFILLKKYQKSYLVKPYVFILTIIGFASFMYHATYTRFWQQVDLGSMFLLSSFFLYVTLRQISFKHPFRISFLVFLFSLLSLIPYKYGPPQTLFGAELAILFVVQIYILYKRKRFIKVNRKYFFLSIVILILASAVRQLGVVGFWCDTDNPVMTAHGLWHLISAVAAYYIFAHVNEAELRLN